MNCLYCGQSVPKYRTNKRFCCHACRQAAYVNRHRVNELGDLYGIDLNRSTKPVYIYDTTKVVIELSEKLYTQFSEIEQTKKNIMILENLIDSLYRVVFLSYQSNIVGVRRELSKVENVFRHTNSGNSRILVKLIEELKTSLSDESNFHFMQPSSLLLNALLVSIRKVLYLTQ